MHHLYRIILLFIFIAFANAPLNAQVLINEILSSNREGLQDIDGDNNDWIELLNVGDAAVDLTGYALSDDYANPMKWIFPAYLIEPGEHLLVWASGKNRRPAQGEMINGLLREVYLNIPGTSVANLLNASKFPDAPDRRNILSHSFEAPINIADNYGQRVRGYLKVPATGNYIFWISSDDNGQLFLSGNEQPEGKQKIAEVPGWTHSRQWDKYPEQRSAPIYLEEGALYYIEALMKEGTGGDNLAVRWQWPDGTIEEPISAQHLFWQESELHTNFSISAAGEEVLLSSSDGILLDEIPPLVIPTDVSYGRSPDGASNFAYFLEPTPAASNTTTGYTEAPEQLNAPVFSHEEGLFTQPISLSLSADPGAEIYFTTNGSLPQQIPTHRYTGPITISDTRLVRAFTYREGSKPSPLTARVFSMADAAISGFNSNLPVVILHQFHTAITSGDRSVAYFSLYDRQPNGRAGLQEKPVLQSRTLANIRGSSSQSFPKKMFGFHMVHENGSNRNEALLDMPEEHNWILYAPYSDKTLMRNSVAYGLSNDMGRYAPRTRFVELYLHSGNGPITQAHYHGVYVIVERIKWDEERVNITKLQSFDDKEPEISGGYIIKKDRLNPGEQGLTTSRGTLLAHVRPNEEEISPRQKEWLIQYLDEFESTLFGDDFKDVHQGYAQYIDVGSFIDYHLITELLKEIDGYRLSTFMHKDRNGKLTMGPVWDFNLSLGNADYLQGWRPQGWYYPLINNTEYLNGWYTRLFEDPAFQKAYKDRWRQLRQSAFSKRHIVDKIRSYQTLLDEAQQRNFVRWPILGTRVWPNYFVGQSYAQEVDWMVNWVESRLRWMDEQLGGALPVVHYWHFNNLSAGEIDKVSPDLSLVEGAEISYPGSGSGYMDRVADGTLLNAVDDTPEGNALRVRNPSDTRFLHLKLPVAGFENIRLSYACLRTNNGATEQQLQYRTSADGEWQDFGPLQLIEENYKLFSYDFSSIEAINDNSQFEVRIAFGGENASGSSGNNRFDNMLVQGDAMDGTNLPPVLAQPIPLQKTIENGIATTLNLSLYFTDPNNEVLSYEISTRHENLLNLMLSNHQLNINGLKRGEEEVEIKAQDPAGAFVTGIFRVLVYPAPHVLSAAGYSFEAWDANAPAGDFPENMLFLQSNVPDPTLGDPLLYAYNIPEDDYHADDAQNIGFPYKNTRRTRINGLADAGISFLNTGRDRDLGGALLALDTRDVFDADLQWLAGTLEQNERIYGLRLQYRLGIEGNFTDLRIGNDFVEYISSTNGHESNFTNIALPAELYNKPYVQLLWRYYPLSGTAGPRAALRLDDIFVRSLAPTALLPEQDLAHSLWHYEGTVYVNAEKSMSENAELAILDTSGKILWQAQLPGVNYYEIRPPLKNGLYIVRLMDGENLLHKKIFFQP
ncbi:MAG: CotH kinase family protein [Cyclobacteriaceae bacterium]|nr:CotH kinase family protein [Cyclobacteriaceae bacterium]